MYVDCAMRQHFSTSRERAYGSRETPTAPVSTDSFTVSLRQPLVLKEARCQVWTNSAVMGALSLSSYTQLVNVALLAGNDFTREHTNLWWHLQHTRGTSKVDKWAMYVTQPSAAGQGGGGVWCNHGAAESEQGVEACIQAEQGHLRGRWRATGNGGQRFYSYWQHNKSFQPLSANILSTLHCSVACRPSCSSHTGSSFSRFCWGGSSQRMDF